MFYKYDSNKLLYRKAGGTILFYFLLSITCAAIFGFAIASKPNKSSVQETTVYLSSDTVVLTSFTPERFVSYMKQVNVKYPHIVYAQSLLETQHFNSKIFQENNNLFGMKQARVRCNVAVNTSRGHALYNHWTESVIDYALYQSSYLYGIKSEAAYFAKLQKSYAGDPTYVDKLKKLIEKHKLEEYVDSI